MGSEEKPLARKLSLLTATSLVVGSMIGTGVFTSLGFQVGGLPSGFVILVLWTVGGVVSLCGALSYAELAAALPRSGGEYHFLSRIFHPAAGFAAGCLSATVGFAAPVALLAMAFGKYLGNILPGLPVVAISAGLTCAITLLLMGGLRLGSWFQDLSTLLKFFLVVAFIVCGFVLAPTPPAGLFSPMASPGLILQPAFATSLIYVMYAYSGWNNSTYMLGEIKDPTRNVPRSIVLGTLLVTVLYVLINAVFMSSVPFGELAGKVEVGLISGVHVFGETGGKLMGLMICAGLISSISSLSWAGARVAMVIGEDLPALGFLAKRSEGGIPYVAQLMQLGLVLVLLFTATFEAVLVFIQFSLSLSAFATVLGMMVLRHTRPELARPYRTPGYPFTPMVFLGVTAYMLVHTAVDKPWESLWGMAFPLAGVLGHFFLAGRGAAGTVGTKGENTEG